jgi:hypothetical protein
VYWQAGFVQAHVRSRAALIVWREHARMWQARIGRSRHFLTSLALVVAGMAGGLGGGALIGRWCLGLVLISESAGLIWLGLMRDDGTGIPRRGARTVHEVLEDERLRL